MIKCDPLQILTSLQVVLKIQVKGTKRKNILQALTWKANTVTKEKAEFSEKRKLNIKGISLQSKKFEQYCITGLQVPHTVL